jgi:hypothetical protein
VTITGGPVTESESARGRLDRPILISNLVSGALCLSPLAVFGPWPLVFMGAVPVVAGGVFLAAVYAHEALSRRQEALAWITPWLVTVLLWTALLAVVDFEHGGLGILVSLSGALVFATPCYLVWQLSALAVRQFMAWRDL